MLICLMKGAYNSEYADWVDEHYAELAASDTVGSIKSYCFDVGTWSRLVRCVKKGRMDVETTSKLAASRGCRISACGIFTTLGNTLNAFPFELARAFLR
mmetsp:Transcript_51088/g.94615  ORF Transcript_51088/g.94615 Transcript_51088/m.94615 type:complete len:99 (+) Transcript_51088:1237-1533(+)